MKHVIATFLGTILWLGGYQPAFAQVTVDCDTAGAGDYDSIFDALAADETFIDFTGTCAGDIEILVSGIRLRGDDPTWFTSTSRAHPGVRAEAPRTTAKGPPAMESI